MRLGNWSKNFDNVTGKSAAGEAAGLSALDDNEAAACRGSSFPIFGKISDATSRFQKIVSRKIYLTYFTRCVFRERTRFKEHVFTFFLLMLQSRAAVGQWLAGLSFNQEVVGSIPTLVDVYLSKTLYPELLLVAVSTVYECNMIVSRFG